MQISTDFVYLAQAVLAMMIMAVMHHYANVYQQQYLRLWAYSFLSLTVFLFCAYLAVSIRSNPLLNEEWIILTNVMLMTTAGYLQILFLLLGTRELVFHRTVRPRSMLMISTAVVLFSVLVSLIGAFDPDGSSLRYLMRIGLRYIAAGIAFLLAVWIMFRFDRSTSTGKRIVMTFFALYGIEMTIIGSFNLQYFVTGSSVYLADTVRYHGLFELLVYSMVGVGLVIWLLETERTRMKKTKRKLSFLDKTDNLTGIANRAGLKHAVNRWQGATDSPSRLQFVLFGVDQFNRINTADGLRRGDEVLVNLARRISFLLANARFVGRLNSDIFVALIDRRNKADLAKIEHLRKELSRPVYIGTRVYHVEFSAGLTEIGLQDDLDLAIMESNLALQSAKKTGGHRVVIYDAGMVMPEFSPILIEHELREAFSRDQFTLNFQPIWSVSNRRIDCFEVLVRWNHPEKGEIMPDSFLPMLIQLGLMQQLDLWVLNQSCIQLRSWHKQGFRSVRLAINLSSESIQSADFITSFTQTYRLHGVDPSHLIIEITENTAMQNIEAGRQTLARMHDLGVRVAIDDFGTGYSSLNYLCSFPSDIIKFDRSFISGVSSDDARLEMLRSLVPLCQKLDKQVVVEGIEIADQHELAERLRVDLVQGYLYACPVSADEALSLLKGKQSMVS